MDSWLKLCLWRFDGVLFSEVSILVLMDSWLKLFIASDATDANAEFQSLF